MSSKFIHRIRASDQVSSQRITSVLAELQRAFIRARTPVGEAISTIISSWRQDQDGTFIVQFSPLAAAQLPAVDGIELLQAARGLAQPPAPLR